MLYIFSGLPGTGKSTLATALSRICNGCYLRVDTIEQTMKNAGISLEGPEGYAIAYALAEDNLRLGMNVIADTVNPIELTREAWRRAAENAKSAFREIEIVCTDLDEHKRRIETRKTSVKGLTLPTWKAVQNREYHPWTGDRIIIDTAGATPEQSIQQLCNELGLSADWYLTAT
ncbi:AAA family ATPase [filamentous cyanobacterium LEGE 07170]|nr:AAA family ATPase [filamentous cyanobacterium LEGE 07170]